MGSSPKLGRSSPLGFSDVKTDCFGLGWIRLGSMVVRLC